MAEKKRETVRGGEGKPGKERWFEEVRVRVRAVLLSPLLLTSLSLAVVASVMLFGSPTSQSLASSSAARPTMLASNQLWKNKIVTRSLTGSYP